MTIIDPMHNLYLGTAKYIVNKIWIGRDILKSSILESSSPMIGYCSSFTAEQIMILGEHLLTLLLALT